MRIARKLFLLTAMALTAVALTAGSAAAQETPVEVLDEATGAHCNPCDVHAAGSSTLFQHVFGTESTVSACTDEFIGTVGEDGSGEITRYFNNHAEDPTVCTRLECADAAERSWPITNAGETGPDLGHFNIRFCLRAEDAADRHCNIEISTEGTNGHVDRFFADDERGETGTSGVYCEVTGSWAVEASTGLQIVHL